MNLLGLFQSHNEIARLQSVRHLENMVFLYSDEHIVSSSVGHIPDPFGSQSIFSLKAWPVSEFAMEPMASSKSSFTHHDLRKVSDIATGNFESNIKAAAIEQLLTMMSSDHKLLVTADINWLISTCSSVIASFETILFGDSDINMVPPTDLAYLLGGAKFLAFTICRSAVLRDRVVFKAAKGSSVSFLPVLKVLILGCTSKSMLELAAEGSNVIQEFCTICAQMMQILATNTESFSKDFQSLTKSFASLTVSVSWMRRGRNETPLKVCPTINVYDYLMTDNFVSAKLLDADSFSLESIENTAEFETTAYMLTVARPVIDVSSDSDTLQEFLSSAGELVSVESIQLLLTTDSFPSQDR